MEEAKSKVLKGIGWNLAEQLAVHFIVFSATVVLSRLLLPDVFGLYAMIAVTGNFVSLLVGLGLSYSVIRNETLSREELSGIFWFNMLAGFCMACLLFFSAGGIALFFGHPELKSIARLFSAGLIAQGCLAVPQGLLIRSMNFKKLAIINIAVTVASYTVAVVFAVRGFGVWSLVAQFLTQQYGISVLTFLYSGWRPLYSFGFSAVRKTLRFSVHFTGSQLLEFAANNIDMVLIGRNLGKRETGLYSRGTALITFPVTTFGYILNRTFFPWFASMQTKPQELQIRYFQAIRALVFIMAPLLLLAGLQAADIVHLVFGKNWMDMAPLVQFFAFFGLVQCVNAFHDSFMVSQGRADLLFRIVFIEKLLLIAGIFIGLQFGLIGLLYAKTLVLSALFIPRTLVVVMVLGTSYLNWLRNFRAEFTGLAVMFALVWFILSNTITLHYLARLAVVSASGLLTYCLILSKLDHSVFYEIKRVLLSHIRSVPDKQP